MADISKIKIPSGTTYNLKDSTARSNITKITNKTTKLAYGDSIEVIGSTLNLKDPNNNVLSSATIPLNKPIIQHNNIKGFIIAAYNFADTTLSSPIAVRKVDSAPTLAANTSYRLLIGNINSGHIAPFTTEGQRYFPNPVDWWDAAGEVIAEETDLSTFGIDNIYEAYTADYDNATVLNNRLPGATITNTKTWIVKNSTDAENTKLDKYLYVVEVDITVGSSAITLNWNSDYSVDVSVSKSEFWSNKEGSSIRFNWSF